MRVLGIGFIVLVFAAAFFAQNEARADVLVGPAYSSVTDGRAVPAAHLGLSFRQTELTAYSTGVRTNSYSLNGYTLAAHGAWNAGKFLWSDLRAGFGWGLHLALRRLRDSDTTVTVWDWATGPAFRVSWALAGPAFLSVESVFGLRNLGLHLLLNFQTVTHVAVGVRF